MGDRGGPPVQGLEEVRDGLDLSLGSAIVSGSLLAIWRRARTSGPDGNV